MNGTAVSVRYEGRVEICYNNTYGTICDDLWSEPAAAVVCREFNSEIKIWGIDPILSYEAFHIFCSICWCSCEW